MERTDIKSLKRELKTWEQEFFQQHGSKPTKAQISADKNIAKKYRLYAKLKNSDGIEEVKQESKLLQHETYFQIPALERKSSLKNKSVTWEKSIKDSFHDYTAPACEDSGRDVHSKPQVQLPAQIIPLNLQQTSKKLSENKNSSNESLKPKRNTINVGPTSTINLEPQQQRSLIARPATKEKQLRKQNSFIHQNVNVSQDYLTNAFQTNEIQSLIQRKKEIQEMCVSKHPFSSEIEEIRCESFVETINLPEDTTLNRPRLAFQEETKKVDKGLEIHSKKDTISPSHESSTKTSAELGLGSNVISDLIIHPKLFLRLPNDCILRCKIFRKKNMLDKTHPTFFLYNETNDKFMLSARKRKKTKSLAYLISTSPDDLSKDSKHYVAKLKANTSRTNFILYDARTYKENAVDKGLKELACVSYTKTVLPRELSVAIHNIELDEDSITIKKDLSKDILGDVKSQSTSSLSFLRNKTPRWNESTQSHCLNFGGRVTQPSIKNFQLIKEGDEGVLVMQFGRCGSDFFTMDLRAPLRPVEAFAIALTSFDAYDNA